MSNAPTITHRPARRRSRAALAALFATSVATVALASAASAAPYVVNTCSDGADPALVAGDGWPSVTAAQAVNDCGDAVQALSLLPTGSKLGEPDSATSTVGYVWTIPSSAPTLRITSAWLSQSSAAQTNVDASGVQLYGTDDHTVVGGINSYTGVYGGFDHWSFTFNTLSSRAFGFHYDCTHHCAFSGAPLSLHRAMFTLDDPTPPSGAAADPVGLLDGTAQAGTRSLVVTARDGDSGVKSVSVRAAGSTTDLAAAATPGCSYTTPIVCDQIHTFTLPIDTTKLPDGTPSLSAVVTDVAGNQKAFDLPSFTVHNTPTPTPTAPSGPNGSGGSPASAHLTTTAKRARLTTDYGRSATITGHLLDGAGKPIVGAAVDVFEQIDAAGAAKAKVTTVTTDAAGTFHYQPSTSSTRTIQFAYAPVIGSTAYTQTAQVSSRVRAGVVASLSTKTARRGQQITLTGKVLAAPLPKRGVSVDIEIWSVDHWRSVQVTRTTQAGAFTWRYRFRLAGHWKLRAKVLGSSDLPALPAASKVLRLTSR